MRRRIYLDSVLFIFLLSFQHQQPSEVVIPDKEPVLLKKVEAIYPPNAYEEKCEGEVVIAILIKADGEVEERRDKRVESKVLLKGICKRILRRN